MAFPSAACRRRRRLHLQTQGGKVAKGVTAAEFVDLMKDLVGQLQRYTPSPLRASEHWLISYDNAGAHTEAEHKVPGLNRQTLPPKSPDMHKVVEHVHAWLTEKMQQWLRAQQTNKVTSEDAQAELKRLFKSYPTDSLRRNVASLPETYKAIIAAGGAFPAKRFR